MILYFAEDKKLNGKIPNSFLGVLRIDPNYEGRKFLNKEYRQYNDNGIEEYIYFVEHLLEQIKKSKTSGKKEQ